MPAAADFGPFEFLRQLTETPGIPGREERVREYLLAETEDFWDETRIDPMGSLICIKRATQKPSRRGKSNGLPSDRPLRVMLACHMDEIGFYVRHIDDKGFVRVHNAGGFDTRNLFSRRVVVHGKRDLLGVMNPTGKPVHIASEEEKKKVPDVKDFCIDLFLSKAEVSKLVEIGDPVTLAQKTETVGQAITGKAMDNRIALWTGINAIRKAYGLDYLIPGENGGKGRKSTRKKTGKRTSRARAGSPYDIYFVACVQEEVGLRGATTAAFGVEPDIGLAIDTTLCCDTPGIGPDDAVTEFGKGVALKVMDSASISHRGLFEEFAALASKHRIPHQREILPRGGTDAGAVQRARAGTRAMTLSVPTRYIHTITEAIHRNDATAAVDLLGAWLRG
jgi:putative aminopeptidase FrvX